MASPFSNSPFLSRVRWWRRLRVRVLVTMLGVTVFVCGTLFVTTYVLRRASLLEQFQRFVMTVAGTGAVAVAGDELAAIEVDVDYVTPEFQRARAVLDVIRRRNGLSEDELYILRPVGEPEAYTAEFVVMVHELPFVGNRYVIREENRGAYRRAWAERAVTATGIYEDAHGTWISGYAPILDGAGEVVALLEADAEIGRYVGALRRELLVEAGVTGLALMLALVPIVFFANRLTRGIVRLAAGLRKFEAGDTDVQLPSESGDEIAAMAETFNRMAASVGERLRLLPFVSRFTAQAVRKSAYVADWLEGQETEAAVLITDVRGFTRSSREVEPRVLVRHLNELLALQTQVVHRHGGDVDKFMGDAVLAVFQGHEDNLGRAVRCGVELMARVRGAGRGWPEGWALGAAVNAGRVIVGAVGSEARRDYTVIGHPVNFGAHLCGAAGRWELLLPRALAERLRPAERGWFGAEGEVKLKHGVAPEPVWVHRAEEAELKSTA